MRHSPITLGIFFLAVFIQWTEADCSKGGEEEVLTDRLVTAIANGRVSEVRAIFEDHPTLDPNDLCVKIKGADLPLVVYSSYSNHALDFACTHGQTEVVKFLLTYRLRINPNVGYLGDPAYYSCRGETFRLVVNSGLIDWNRRQSFHYLDLVGHVICDQPLEDVKWFFSWAIVDLQEMFVYRHGNDDGGWVEDFWSHMDLATYECGGEVKDLLNRYLADRVKTQAELRKEVQEKEGRES